MNLIVSETGYAFWRTTAAVDNYMMRGVEWNQKAADLCSFLESHLYRTKPNRDPDVC